MAFNGKLTLKLTLKLDGSSGSAGGPAGVALVAHRLERLFITIINFNYSFGAGFCFTVVYAALLTKTNRISRIFKHGKQSAKRPSLISPRSQLVICSGLTLIQIVINAVWVLISPARAMHHYPTREDNLLVCDSYIDASYMIAFSYPIVLIVICTVYAVLTRKIPEAFNESKHIGECLSRFCWFCMKTLPLASGHDCVVLVKNS